MSDTNAYVNAYIDNAIGMIHENVNVILQLKTQVKIANDVIKEKDGIIGSLTPQLESSKVNFNEMVVLRDKVKSLEESYNTMLIKASHVDTALAQITQMKAEIKQRDDKIAKLKEQLALALKPTKKTINTKNKLVAVAGDAKDEVSNTPVAIAGNATDDF